MASRILAFSASPRSQSNSDLLLDQIVAGSRQAGAHVTKVRLSELAIGPCHACNHCRTQAEPTCVLQDDMVPLLAQLRAADAYILAAPIYFFGAAAQLKVFLDRWYALPGNEGFSVLAGRRMAAAFTYGASDPIASGVFNAHGMVRDICRFLRFTYVGWVHASCGAQGEIASAKSLLADAEALGRRLVGEA